MRHFMQYCAAVGYYNYLLHLSSGLSDEMTLQISSIVKYIHKLDTVFYNYFFTETPMQPLVL